MSFILDALKKSESERKRQGAPGIASIPDAGRQNTPARWPWVVAGLLTINLIVLTVVVLKPAPAIAPQTGADTSPAESTRVPEPATRELPDPVPAAVTPAQSAPAQSVADSVDAGGVSTRASQTPTVTNVEPPAARPPTITEGLPTLRELIAAGQMQLPDMHLDIHVYSGQPDDRFVFVNMTKYTEGATLTEGPSITEITPDGVVLDYFGTRFLLPRE